MKKVLLFLFALFLFFQFSAGNANAVECTVQCALTGSYKSETYCIQHPMDTSAIPTNFPVTSSCIINSGGTWTGAWSIGNYCYDTTNNKYCKTSTCPTPADNANVANQNGVTCKVSLPCTSGDSCSSIDYDGKWDASDSKCVICGSNKESIICGDSAGTYIGDGNNIYSPNIACPNFIWCSKAGDQKFESACGADSACDEKAQGATCTTTDGKNGNCDSNGKCITQGCISCDSGATPCGSCSSANSGKRCVDVGGVGQLKVDTTCNPYVPCKSCPDGTALWECSSSGQRCNPVGGVCTLQNDVSCVKATGCSAYNGDARNCNSAGGCYYCAVYGACLSAGDTSCPGYVDCS